jgi:endonuclease YncB( thermonuclease family)
MMGECRGPALGGAAAMLLALCPFAPAAFACGSEALGESRVAAIEDTRTLRLADGRTIRLAAIEWGVSADAARAALSDLALGRQITLKSVSLKGTGTADRYGRIHAFPFVSGSETPIQYALLDRGLAVTGTRIGDAACRKSLLAREQAARAARLGIWGSGDYRLHQADDPAAILKDLGRFAIVQGRVLSVRESGNTVYVNFGRRWSEDFTVTIAKRTEAAFISAGVPPKSLAGRTVRVRGVIEERAGPWIEAAAADQFDWDGQP